MATVVFEVYPKYWPKAALDDLLTAIQAKLQERGITATVSTSEKTIPQRTTVTLTGVPANLVVRHEDIVNKINQRLGLGLSY